MRKLLTFLIALVTIVFGVCSLASAFYQSRDSNYNVAIASASPSFSLTGAVSPINSSATTIDYGTMNYGGTGFNGVVG